MNIIPEAVRALFQQLFKRFTSSPDSDYHQQILSQAADDEERRDLQELFQSTDEYYAERKRMNTSDDTPGEYFRKVYMEAWEEQNPNASDQIRHEAEQEFLQTLDDSVILALERIQQDGKLRSTLDKIIRNNRNADQETRDQAIQLFLDEVSAKDDKEKDEDDYLKN